MAYDGEGQRFVVFAFMLEGGLRQRIARIQLDVLVGFGKGDVHGNQLRAVAIEQRVSSSAIRLRFHGQRPTSARERLPAAPSQIATIDEAKLEGDLS